MLSSIKKILNKKKVTSFSYSTTKEVQFNELDENNSYDRFRQSLTPEQQETDILLLGDELIYQNIKSLFNFQLDVIPDQNDVFNKSIVLFAHMLLKQNVSTFNLNIDFDGTKYEIKEEKFCINFSDYSLNPKTISPFVDNSIELSDDENLKSPKEKISFLIDQKENVLSLLSEIKKVMPNLESENLCFSTASLIHVMEYISLINAADVNANLENLISQNKDTGVSFAVNIFRKEIDYPSLSINLPKIN